MIMCKNPYFKFGRGLRSLRNLPVSTDLVKNMTPFPCGQCEHCRAQLAKKWTNRMDWESQDYPAEEILFITLTYAPEYLPEDGHLNKHHLRNFIKRLRNVYSFRYFAVGEYGSKHWRPHYHLITFGLRKICPHTVCNYNPDTCDCYFVHKWTYGRIEVELVRNSKKAMKYATGYAFNKRTKKDDPYLKGREPEFKTSSTKPPLGYNYVSRRFAKLMQDYGKFYEGDFRTMQKGKTKMNLDRHLREKIVMECEGNRDRLDREYQEFAWWNFVNSYDETGKTKFDKNCMAITATRREQVEQRRRQFRKGRKLD